MKYFIFGGTEEGLPDEVPSKIKYLTTRRSFRRGSIALWVFSDEEGLSRREGKYPKGYTDEEKYRRGADVEWCSLGTGCCELRWLIMCPSANGKSKNSAKIDIRALVFLFSILFYFSTCSPRDTARVFLVFFFVSICFYGQTLLLPWCMYLFFCTT